MSDEPKTPEAENHYAGLLRGPKVNPVLGGPSPVGTKREGTPGRDPAYVLADEVLKPLSVRIPVRTRNLAKRNALLRGISMQDYIALLIERDATTG